MSIMLWFLIFLRKFVYCVLLHLCTNERNVMFLTGKGMNLVMTRRWPTENCFNRSASLPTFSSHKVKHNNKEKMLFNWSLYHKNIISDQQCPLTFSLSLFLWLCRCEERWPCIYLYAHGSGAGGGHVGLCSDWSGTLHCGQLLSLLFYF